MAEKKKQVNAASFYGEGAIIGDMDVETVRVGETICVASLTTAERDALTAVNGMIVYNSTDNKFQGYENGVWANLI
jgi:hypothetical protein|tara:strand:+ start:8859 stop:9086 length:228 start_codon:yes stop_codon:yes gene_type:complete